MNKRDRWDRRCNVSISCYRQIRYRSAHHARGEERGRTGWYTYVLVSNPPSSSLVQVTLKVDMMCEGCVGAVKRILGKLEGWWFLLCLPSILPVIPPLNF